MLFTVSLLQCQAQNEYTIYVRCGNWSGPFRAGLVVYIEEKDVYKSKRIQTTICCERNDVDVLVVFPMLATDCEFHFLTYTRLKDHETFLPKIQTRALLVFRFNIPALQ
jgi:hypothetical protein